MAATDFEISITRDDRGRIIAEVWHKQSGQTVGITEVDTVADGRHWARKLIGQQIERSEAQS
jgi:hypothetical protein